MACSLTLPDDESTGELESADAELNPADAEPCVQPQSRCGTASSRGVSPQRSSGSSRLSQLSQHRGHCNNSDRTVAEPKPAAEPYHRSQSPHSTASSLASSPTSSPASNPGVETQQWSDPLVQDNGREQNEGVVVLSRAQEIRASMPRLPVEGSNVPEQAHAEPSIQPSASPDQANGPSDRGSCSPLEDSVAEHGQDDDFAQPPCKRRRTRSSSPTTCRTTPEPQTRRHHAGQTRRRTIQHLKPRQSQCPSDVPKDQRQ